MVFDPDRPNAHAEARATFVEVSKSPLELDASEVESQLDAVLAGGEHCLMAVEEMTERHGRLQSTLDALADGDAARYAAARPCGFGACGICKIGPAVACVRCSRGVGHPGESCVAPDGRESIRNRVCRGVSLYAHLTAKIREERGEYETAREIRADMGLEVRE